MSKKIMFMRSHRYNKIGVDEREIVSASKIIPDWYKKIPPSIPADDPSREASTVKKCLPFLDALNLGYYAVLPHDLLVQDHENEKYIRVIDNFNTIELETHNRTNGIPIPNGYYPIMWRLIGLPHITTPDEYSILVTHPLNRNDLPFLTLSGVIDTDKLSMVLSVTFYIRNDFVGIIPKGTPIAQIIPLKRDNWKHEFTEPISEKEHQKIKFKVLSKIERSYQKQFWQRKSYL